MDSRNAALNLREWRTQPRLAHRTPRPERRPRVMTPWRPDSVVSDQSSSDLRVETPTGPFEGQGNRVAMSAGVGYSGMNQAWRATDAENNSTVRPFDSTLPSSFIDMPIDTPIAPRQTPANDEGYVPMGHFPQWYAKHILDPFLWERRLRETGISINYCGNIFLESNQCANIPEEFSTSLWLTNLPPDCTHQQLLGSIRGCGKIFAAVINPPVFNTRRYNKRAPHTTSASKLVFFDRLGLDRLLAKAQAGEFSVGGYVPRVRMNRIKSAPRVPGPQCRVIHINGPSAIVNTRFLNKFFQSKFTYELEAILTLQDHGGWTRQEWRFGSFRCQADSARQSISREKLRQNMSEHESLLWQDVTVHFGVDPCA